MLPSPANPGAAKRGAWPQPWVSSLLQFSLSNWSHLQFYCSGLLFFLIDVSIVLVKYNFRTLFLFQPSFKVALGFTKWEGWATHYLDPISVFSGLLCPGGPLRQAQGVSSLSELGKPPTNNETQLNRLRKNLNKVLGQVSK